MIDNKYDVELDGQGYIVKKDSYNRQLARQFVNEIAVDELSYQDFSIWKVLAQTDWAGGYDNNDWFPENVFKESHGIDIHYNHHYGEFRLSKALSDNLDTTPSMAGATRTMISYGGKWYICNGSNVYVSATGAAGTYVLSKACGNRIWDAVIFEGYLFVFMGTNGYWRFDNSVWVQESDGSQAPAGLNEKIKYAEVWSPSGNVSFIYGTYDGVLRKGEWSTLNTRIDWTDLKTFKEDVDVFPGKPLIFNYNLYLWVKRYSENQGRSQMWVYNGDSVVPITGSDTDGTIGARMTVYKNKIYYFEVGYEFAFIKTFDGSQFETSLKIEAAGSGATYNTFNYAATGISGSSGCTLYDQDSTALLDPCYWAVHDDKLLFTAQSQSADNFLYEFDNIGWNRRNDFQLDPNATYCLGVFAKQVYISNDIGEIWRISKAYNSTGYLLSSIYDANLANTDKVINEIQLKTKPLQSGVGIEVEYDLEESGSFTSLTLPELYGGMTDIRIPVSSSDGTIIGKRIRIKTTLTTIDDNNTPIINDVILKYAPTPDSLNRYQMTLLTIDGLELYDGSYETTPAEDLAADLFSARATKRVIEYKGLEYTTTTLDGNITNLANVIDLVDASTLPRKGTIKVDSERILYTGKTGNQLTGCVRGYKGSVATSHLSGVLVDNSIDVVVWDATETEHLMNQFDGDETLVQMILYEAD